VKEKENICAREIRAWDPDFTGNGFITAPRMKRKVLILIATLKMMNNLFLHLIHQSELLIKSPMHSGQSLNEPKRGP
jgi:hypothetical protein